MGEEEGGNRRGNCAQKAGKTKKQVNMQLGRRLVDKLHEAGILSLVRTCKKILERSFRAFAASKTSSTNFEPACDNGVGGRSQGH